MLQPSRTASGHRLNKNSFFFSFFYFLGPELGGIEVSCSEEIEVWKQSGCNMVLIIFIVFSYHTNSYYFGAILLYQGKKTSIRKEIYFLVAADKSFLLPKARKVFNN